MTRPRSARKEQAKTAAGKGGLKIGEGAAFSTSAVLDTPGEAYLRLEPERIKTNLYHAFGYLKSLKPLTIRDLNTRPD